MPAKTGHQEPGTGRKHWDPGQQLWSQGLEAAMCNEDSHGCWQKPSPRQALSQEAGTVLPSLSSHACMTVREKVLDRIRASSGGLEGTRKFLCSQPHRVVSEGLRRERMGKVDLTVPYNELP